MVYELKNQRQSDPFPPLTYDENANWQFVYMTPKQKEYFFRVLLEKLNSSMCGSCFPCGSQSTSLPQIGGCQALDQAQGSHFSQFLWSVATHGGQAPSSMQRDVSHKGAQTETVTSDPLGKEGLWSIQARSHDILKPGANPPMVYSSTRSVQRTLPQKTRSLGRLI